VAAIGDSFLTEVWTRKGSDLHFIAGDPRGVARPGDLMPLRPHKLAAGEFRQNRRSTGDQCEKGGSPFSRAKGRRGFRLTLCESRPAFRVS